MTVIADGIRVMALTVIILAVGFIAGSGMVTGPVGALSVVVLAGMFGLAHAGIGMTIALLTGSTKASQVGFLVFFPLLFLSPARPPECSTGVRRSGEESQPRARTLSSYLRVPVPP